SLSSTTLSTFNSDKTAYLKLFSESVGVKFNTFTQGFNLIANRVYGHYANDVYSQLNALNRLKKKLGLNCSDITQLLYQMGKDLGYNVAYEHVMCKVSGGHIRLKISGGEFGNLGTQIKNWKTVDGAAQLKSGQGINNIWCPDGAIVSYNDKWLQSDDGKT
ncbi:MAG: hypothetical protein K8E24_015015, partial [Methanobacterium paludis]|nr:hypothetical protein [Methanobacterium paludis]